jgi:MFS family permease
VGQFIGGLAGVGVGVLVGLVLNRYAFPADYALLFALAGVMMALAAIALALIREPPPEEADPDTESKAAGGWLKPLLTDRVFGHLMACRMLVGMVDMAIPFYVGHAEKVLRLPESTVGGFVIAQTVAGVIASPVLGWINERWGARNVIRIGSAAAAIGPLFALAAHLAGGGWLARAYPFVYVALGVVNSSWMLGFFNYMLEIAPPGIRSVYVGLGNTIMGALTLLPMLGGWLLEATSYTTLFGVTAGTVGLGFLLTLWLKPTQPTTPAEDGRTGCTLPPHPTTDGTV